MLNLLVNYIYKSLYKNLDKIAKKIKMTGNFAGMTAHLSCLRIRNKIFIKVYEFSLQNLMIKYV